MSDVFEVEVLRDLTYSVINGKPLLLDLYRPRGTGGPLPVIIWLHGGGWRFGDRKLGPDLSRYFAQHGFAMASIEYRSSDEAKFPAALEDVKTAIHWLRAQSPQYGLAPNRIGLWGSSSGGHLAALAALTSPSEVQAVVDGYGPTDFLQIDAHRLTTGTYEDDPESMQLPPDLRSSSPDSFESRFLGAPIATCPELVQRANPVTYAHSGAPPFLILHGLSDTAIPPNQSELLYNALATYSNNEVTLCIVSGLGHGFLNRNHLDDGPPRKIEMRGTSLRATRPGIFKMIEEFFRRHLYA